MRCLLVEDEVMSRLMLKELLPSSFEVDVAVNGEEAIESFNWAHDSKRPYGLILMDIEMPGIDGYEAAKRIREIECKMGVPPQFEVKIVMTTAHDDPKTVVDTFNKGGATSFLVKPIAKQKLLMEIRKLGLAS